MKKYEIVPGKEGAHGWKGQVVMLDNSMTDDSAEQLIQAGFPHLREKQVSVVPPKAKDINS